ncbi:MAG: rRNA pseudouridine synthase [Anaerolineales bacterium]|nr:rRNA pseudouridine synthase [Anaerolineales bacterium]
MPTERLQKIMAAAGVGSRRHCETLIEAGRVRVNGEVVTELGAKADPVRDTILVDGQRLAPAPVHRYYKVHKPRGVLSDIGGDTGDRKTVADLLPEGSGRVFAVGRLDLHSEGLVLLTDDGELANRLTHPRYQHPKTYFVLVGETPSGAAFEQLRNGVDLPEGRTAPAEAAVAERLPVPLQLSKGPTEGVWLRIVLREGKKRQIRNMTAAVGYPTLRLVRWSIGPLTLGDLELGEYAPLTPYELASLMDMAGIAHEKPPKSERKHYVRRPAGKRTPGKSERDGADGGKKPARPRKVDAKGKPPRAAKPAGAGSGKKVSRPPGSSESGPTRTASKPSAGGRTQGAHPPAKTTSSGRKPGAKPQKRAPNDA